MSGPQIITFGCRLNAYESQVMDGLARKAKLDDAVIVNTCAVTAEAERQARQAIRRARRERPEARIVVTGCAAQIDPSKYADMPEVDTVLGNREKLDAANFVAPDTEPVRVNDIMAATETASHLVSGFEDRARAFVQVQNGCDHRCTFCIIPFGRGNEPFGCRWARNRRVRCELLVENGYRRSGADRRRHHRLRQADLPGRPSAGFATCVRIGSWPQCPSCRACASRRVDRWKSTTNSCCAFIAEEERVMPHLHLSLQAGDDMILKRMKRRHRGPTPSSSATRCDGGGRMSCSAPT